MNTSEFRRRLVHLWDNRLTVEKDPRDLCLVVYDVSREGNKYPAHKVCASAGNPDGSPALLGIPREPSDRDILELRKKDWSARFKGTKGEAKRLSQMLRDKEAEKDLARRRSVRETVDEKVKPEIEWRAGVRNSIAVNPHESLKNTSTGS